MMDYKIMTYASQYGPVNCYLIDDTIYLAQKEVAKLLNVTDYKISKIIKAFENKGVFVAKMQLINERGSPVLLQTKSIIDIGKELGCFSIIDFENWVEETLHPIDILDRNETKIIRFNQGDLAIDVRFDFNENTVWLSQDQIATLLDTSRQNITMHLANIYADEELEFGATCKDFLLVQIEGGRSIKRNVSHYNLDMIISLGFRVNSKVAIAFRRWANKVLKSYLTKGCAINLNHDKLLLFTEKLLSLDNKTDKIELRVNKLEEQFDKSINELIIQDGQFFDGITLLQKLCSNAKERIILIDGYADSKALNVLKNKDDKVDALIITSNHSKLSKNDVDAFIKQYGLITVIQSDEFHDRYLFVDEKGYHLGTSINYLGNKISQIDELRDQKTIDYLLSRVAS